jgi:hypothetical protein
MTIKDIQALVLTGLLVVVSGPALAQLSDVDESPLADLSITELVQESLQAQAKHAVKRWLNQSGSQLESVEFIRTQMVTVSPVANGNAVSIAGFNLPLRVQYRDRRGNGHSMQLTFLSRRAFRVWVESAMNPKTGEREIVTRYPVPKEYERGQGEVAVLWDYSARRALLNVEDKRLKPEFKSKQFRPLTGDVCTDAFLRVAAE